jgi:hypothetical protein
MDRFLVQGTDRFWRCSARGWVYHPLKKYAADSVIETLPEYISDRYQAFDAHRCDEVRRNRILFRPLHH